MTARISRNFEFMAGVTFDNEFYMNSYDVTTTFTVETDSIEEQNIALERIKYLLNEALEHSVFLRDTDTEGFDRFTDAGIKVCTLPEDPYDQIIGIMLLVKMNAISEGRLVASDIEITSRMSDGVYCMHSIEENIGPFNNKGWWNDTTPKINSIAPKSRGKKVVKLTKTPSAWDELSLGWVTKPIERITNEVVFASFDKLDK
jgi:hypothetical protein